ncbi:hypothetical protein BH23ACT11_BH23ACT11_10310 [soil metagenome]
MLSHVTKRPDVVLYVNGIALAVLELKRSTVSVGEGSRQNIGNQKPDCPSRTSTAQTSRHDAELRMPIQIQYRRPVGSTRNGALMAPHCDRLRRLVAISAARTGGYAL